MENSKEVDTGEILNFTKTVCILQSAFLLTDYKTF